MLTSHITTNHLSKLINLNAILLPKVQNLFNFLQLFSLTYIFLPRYPIQNPALHLVVRSLLSPPIFDSSCLSLSIMTLTFLKWNGSLYSLSMFWVCAIFPHDRLTSCIIGKDTKEVMCSSQCFMSRYNVSMLVTAYVDLDHLVNGVSVSFLHCNIFISPFLTTQLGRRIV